MKRVFGWGLMIALLVGAFSACNRAAKERSTVLKVYNWADYIDEEVLSEFEAWYEEQTGEKVRVIYQLFDINEIMLAKIERGKEDFDVACPSDYIIERMLNHDLLLPIDKDFGDTPNYIDNVSPYIRGELDKISKPGKRAEDYAVGYMWGTTGILYNKAHVTEEEASSWSCLWNPKFAGKIFMKDAYRDVYGSVLIYARYDDLKAGRVTLDQLMNDFSPESIAQVEDSLKKAKSLIAGWEADFGKEMMTKEKAYLNLTWSGDAVWAIEEAADIGIDLGYTVPREGSSVWYDGWVIPKYARNRKAASYFINYMCRPDNALRNMDAIGYVSAVATPEILAEKIDSSLTEYSDLSYFFGPEADSVPVDRVQYPDRSVIERCAMMHDLGTNTQPMLEMWSHVKGDNLGSGVVILIFVVLAGMIGWGVYRKWNRRRRTTRRRRRY